MKQITRRICSLLLALLVCAQALPAALAQQEEAAPAVVGYGYASNAEGYVSLYDEAGNLIGRVANGARLSVTDARRDGRTFVHFGAVTGWVADADLAEEPPTGSMAGEAPPNSLMPIETDAPVVGGSPAGDGDGAAADGDDTPADDTAPEAGDTPADDTETNVPGDFDGDIPVGDAPAGEDDTPADDTAPEAGDTPADDTETNVPGDFDGDIPVGDAPAGEDDTPADDTAPEAGDTPADDTETNVPGDIDGDIPVGDAPAGEDDTPADDANTPNAASPTEAPVSRSFGAMRELPEGGSESVWVASVGVLTSLLDTEEGPVVVPTHQLTFGDDATEQRRVGYVHAPRTGQAGLRQEPSKTAKVITQLKAGQLAAVLEIGEEYARVNVDGQEGWLRLDCLRYLLPTDEGIIAASSKEAQALLETGEKDGEGEQPGADDAAADEVPSGEAEVLIAVEGQAAKAAAYPCKGILVYREDSTGSENVNLRNAPDQGSAKAAVRPTGTEVNVLSVSGSWYLVESEGICAYVKEAFVQPAE